MARLADVAAMSESAAPLIKAHAGKSHGGKKLPQWMNGSIGVGKRLLGKHTRRLADYCMPALMVGRCWHALCAC